MAMTMTFQLIVFCVVTLRLIGEF